MRGVFVTGTDTGAGKSVVAGAICAALAARGERVAAFKPVVTGLNEEPRRWPHDHELLAASANAGQSAEEVAPYRFGALASPHLAAELAGVRIEPSRLLAHATQAGRGVDALVVEGVGGLMVPLTNEYLVRDFAVDLGLPAVLAARPGLGTINHTLLTADAGRRAGLRVLGTVLTPWPPTPSAVEASNRETIEQLTATRVATLPLTEPESLLEAGRGLPLDELVLSG